MEAQNCSLTRMILGFFFLFHFLEVLSGREGFFAKKGGVSLVRNRDLRPAAKANPPSNRPLKGSKSTIGSRTSPKARSTSTPQRAEASFGFWEIQSSPSLPSQRKRWRTIPTAGCCSWLWEVSARRSGCCRVPCCLLRCLPYLRSGMRQNAAGKRHVRHPGGG